MSMDGLIMDKSIIRQADFSTVPAPVLLWEKPRMAGSEETKAILRQRIAERLRALGRSPHSVSVAIGANPGYVRDLLDPAKTSIPGAERLATLAAELETTTDYLMGRANKADQPVSEVSFREMPTAWQHSGGDGIPVLGTGYCEDLIVEQEDGEEFRVERVLLETDHVVHMVTRPPALWNATDAYAIYFHGSSMEPRYFQGEVGLVDPRRPAGPGDFVVVQLTDGESDEVVTVIVKQLVRIAGGFIYLRQFNPDRTFRIPRARVKRLHRIVPPIEFLRA